MKTKQNRLNKNYKDMHNSKKSSLSHSKSKPQWCRIGLIIGLLGILNFGCNKENENTNVVADEYYVKYIVNSSTPYVEGGKSISRTAQITSENNSNKSFTFNKSAWETTIGPVKKGFHASLNSSFSQVFGGPNRTYINIEIHVSKNNGPFALKASNTSTQERFSASCKYTINN